MATDRRAARMLAPVRWWHRFLLRADEVGIRSHAASIAYHSIVAITSLVSVGLYLTEKLGVLDSLQKSMTLPAALEAAVEEHAGQLQRLDETGIAILGLAGVLVGLWGTATACAALFDALNHLYGTHRYHRMVFRYGRALALSVALVACWLGLVAWFGNTSASRTGLGALALLVALLVRYGSEARPVWRECGLVGFVVACGWVIFMLAVRATFELVTPYRTYGALSGVLAVMLIVYWSTYLLLGCALLAHDHFTGDGDRAPAAR